MEHHLKGSRIIMGREIFQQGNLTDIRQFLLLVAFICNNIEHTRFQFPSIHHILSGGVGKIRLFQTKIDIIRQIIILKDRLFLEQILRKKHLRDNPLADLIARDPILLKHLPQLLHIVCRAAVIIGKIHQRHLIILLPLEQLEAQIT